MLKKEELLTSQQLNWRVKNVLGLKFNEIFQKTVKKA